MASDLVTQARVKELFSYSPETGDLIRYKTRKLGSINGTGYRQFLVDGRMYNAHRLVWLYVYGELPSCDVDHVNGIRDDNRITNLRLATRSQNLQNIRKPRSDNKTGFMGVHFSNAKGKFIAKIELLGKVKQLGYFKTAEEAGAAYIRAKRDLHEFCTI